MTDLSPTQVALNLAELSRELDTAKDQLRAADIEAVRARHAYKVAYAKAFISAEASNAETKKQLAVLSAQELDLKAEVCDATVRHLKTHITVLRERIHVGQSYGAAVRSEWGAS